MLMQIGHGRLFNGMLTCLLLIREISCQALLLGFFSLLGYEQSIKCTCMVGIPDKKLNESYSACVINSMYLCCNFGVVSVNLLHVGSHHTTSPITLAALSFFLFSWSSWFLFLF